MKLLFLILILLLSVSLKAQNIENIVKTKPVTTTGGLNLNMQEDIIHDSTNNSYYLTGNLSSCFWGVFNVPVSFAYTNNNFTKNMALPFNRFSLNPSYKDFTLYAGYNSMIFSDYTMNGHDFLGGGMSYHPSHGWNVEGFSGRLKKAVKPDSTTTDAGYASFGGGMKIGYKSDQYSIFANFIEIKDKEKSVDFTGFENQCVAPENNFAASIKTEFQIKENLSFTGEYAFSKMAESNDVFLYKAFECAMAYNSEAGSLGLSYRRLPPNYRTLGGYYFNEDEELLTVNFSVDKIPKTNISGDAGIRHDNIENQNVTTDKNVAFSFSIDSEITSSLKLNLLLNNDQSYVNLKDNYQQLVKTSDFEDFDTCKYSRINTTLNFGANYQLPEKKTVSQNLYSSLLYQKTSGSQHYDTLFSNAKIFNANLGYSSTFSGAKITLATNLGFNKTTGIVYNSEIKTITLNVGKKIAEKFVLSFVYTFAETKNETLRTDIQNVKLNMLWTLLHRHSISFSTCYIRNPSSDNKYTLNLSYVYNFSIWANEKNSKNKES